jgi:uncharacterized protein (TIGR02444 family)
MRARDFAARIYAQPGVETICLRLQDDEGQCVPLLLWRLWSVHEGRRVHAVLLDRAVEVARSWERLVVAPLREVRRRLKAPLPPAADAVRAALRDQVAAVELAAERIVLDALDALTPQPGGVRVDPLEALLALGARWGGPPSADGLERLILAASAYGPLAEPRRSATH